MFQKYLIIFLLFVVSFLPFKVYSGDKNKGPYLVLNNVSDSGMFAVFFSVLGALDFYEQGNYAGLKIDFNTGRYLDPSRGPNWWEYFFEPIKLGKEKKQKYYFTANDYLNLTHNYAFRQDKQRAFELYKRYIHLKPDIKEEIDLFVKKNFKRHFVIGIHHRGTDKITEHPLVPYEKTYQVLCQVIDKLSEKQKIKLKIFVATDDQNFLSFISERFPTLVIYNNLVRSNNGIALHDYSGNFYTNNYQMGKEAILDCFILSKCDFLIRPGSSCLSAVSTRLNPDLQAIDLIAD